MRSGADVSASWCDSGVMRATVDLRDDLLTRPRALARDREMSLWATTELIEAALTRSEGAAEVEISPVTGLPVIHIGRVMTSEDVASLWADE
jgi:hypothetical protein